MAIAKLKTKQQIEEEKRAVAREQCQWFFDAVRHNSEFWSGPPEKRREAIERGEVLLLKFD